MSLYSASNKKLNYLSMLMDSNVNQYPICALCPLSPHQWNCAQIPILTSHLCFQLALLFLLPGCKRSMLRNAPELLWDGLFISGIHSRISWENGSAFRADPQRRHSSTGLLPQGTLLSFHTIELMLSCQCQLSTGKNYPTPRSGKLQVDLCTLLIDSFGVSEHPLTRPVFSSKFSLTMGGIEDQPRWRGTVAAENLGPGYFLLPCQTKTVLKSMLTGQQGSPRLSLSSLPILAQFLNLIPWGMLRSCCAARKVTQNCLWSKLPVRVFIFWNFHNLWELQPFTVILRAGWSQDLQGRVFLKFL